MTEIVYFDYEVASEGAIRHWEVPYASLLDITPTPTNAGEIATTRLLDHGLELTGTILTIDAVNLVAVLDVTSGMVYMHDVRNVLTYGAGPAGVEATFGPINIGDPVYYDPSSTMVGFGIYLSTSPTDNSAGVGAVANSRFGWVVPAPLAGAFDTDTGSFPRGAALVGSTHRVAIMQRGAGG